MKKYIFITTLGLLFFLGGFLYLRRLIIELPDLASLDEFRPVLVTRLFDRKGAVIDELFIERRALVPLSSIPVDLQNAIISVEDTDFFRHWGINLRGIFRAFVKNVMAFRIVEGGSTLTQQLAKVLFLTRERTVGRKIKELLLAVILEKEYSKQEILQFYLNQIYFGHGAYGVQKAARLYFGKDVLGLTLGESALLAGLPRAPNYYSPYRNLLRAYRRRAVILRRMRQLGYIDEEQEISARGEKLPARLNQEAGKTAGYFTEYVRQYLEDRYGYNALYKGGLKVYTTLDLDFQKHAEGIMEEHLNKFDQDKVVEIRRLKEHGRKIPFDLKKTVDDKGKETEEVEMKVQGAMLAMNPSSGEMLVMIGGRDFRETQFNRSVQARRQPGSSFKLFTYTTAIDKGYTVVTRLEDSPRAYIYEQARWKLLSRTADLSDIPVDILSRIDPERIWIPQNYDPEYHGEMFLMDALRRSVNVCAVDLVMRLDPLNVIQMARRLGITSPLAPSPSLTLGGFEVTLIEMVRAYAVIPHEGIMVEPFAVFRVEDNNGNVLESNSSQETRVLTPQVSYVICWLLQQVAERGTGWYTKYLGRPRAGKTGTTNNFTDAWFIGFTPALICGVWTGYDQQVTLGSKKAGGVVSAPIWTDFMKKALEGSPQLDFKVSEGVSFVPVNRYTGLKTFPDDPGVMLVPFIAGTEPAEFHREDMLLTVPVEEEEESW